MDKVLVCQKQHGNPSKTHTMCISSAAVPMHLSHGAYLGACNQQMITSENNSAVEELVNSNNIMLEAYPNPSLAQFTLEPKFPGKSLIQLVVYDGSGRIIEKRTVNANQRIQLGAAYRPGIYLVECIQGDVRARTKLVKQ